jgi:Raf kinase inhibitor-like YbhB/YbcL family protein
MAQRTGADGLIAPRAKITSAAAIAALVIAAALTASGCGGDSDAQTASVSHPTTSAEEATSTAPASKEAPPAGTGSSSEGQKPAGAKHGPHIVLPKGAPEPGPTPQQRAEATVINMTLQSPALLPGSAGSEERLPATYTCDGKDISPPLRWRGIPQGTKELALLVLNLEPVNEALFFDWAVAGLDPSLESLEADQLPKGAILGRNGFGRNAYSICPPEGQETYIFALYALSRKLSPKQGFDPAALRQKILDLNGNAGILAASYGRG